jgi:biopolymer transport protein ExbD
MEPTRLEKFRKTYRRVLIVVWAALLVYLFFTFQRARRRTREDAARRAAFTGKQWDLVASPGENSVSVTMLEDGSLVLAGEKVSRDSLGPRLSERIQGDTSTVLVLNTPANTGMDQIYELLKWVEELPIHRLYYTSPDSGK